ncbi:MAG: undecaprenyldiphospho-muramoylpentapeptide beta-N-acetylglucosaminyltransferase [Betaproteobacteria bacterium]|nr:undecaprenyldiphospho-muramoylpentapeptide beta-N-acetylglucosaminyltransferase [Betaproteobacteria bacterium]
MTSKTCLGRVVIAAGGTGGHIFPALAVAQSLALLGIESHWVGSNRGLEARVVRDQAGFPLTELSLAGVRGRGLAGALALPMGLLRSLIQSWKLVSQVRPAMVLVFGGYVSFPVGIAARLQGYPLIVHEQNAVMGTANRWLARCAQRVLTSFARTRYAPRNAIAVGNPVRAGLAAQSPSERGFGQGRPLRLLILGGSLGARALNQAMPKVWPHVAWPEGLSVWHQTGVADEASVREAYAQAEMGKLESRVSAFIEDMAAAYAWADLVVCRAGASTVAELAALGLPAVFVPLPGAIDDHQTANARALVELSAAFLVPQSAELAQDLIAVLGQCTAQRLKTMAGAAQGLQAGQALDRFLDQLAAVWPALPRRPAGEEARA